MSQKCPFFWFKECFGKGLVFSRIAGYFCFHVILKFCHFFSSPFLSRTSRSPTPFKPLFLFQNQCFLKTTSLILQTSKSFILFHQSWMFWSSKSQVFHNLSLFRVGPILSRAVLYPITIRKQVHFPTSVYPLPNFLLLCAVWK